MGSRGSSSGNNKYAGRYADGSNDQLMAARRNLEGYIKRATEQVKSQQAGLKMGIDVSEQLKINSNSLKELKLQRKELKAEFARRGLNYGR